MSLSQLKPGMRVRITQTIRRSGGDWQMSVTGQVLSCGLEQTGSWHAHSPQGKLMLTRIRLRKDDGELTAVNLDDSSRVEIIEAGAGT